MDLSNFLLTDIFYKNNKGEYELGPKNEFIENDHNQIMDDLRIILEKFMLALSLEKPFLAQYDMQIDYYALAQALHKFTRDIFGPRRLKAVVKEAVNYKDIRGHMKEFGLKMNSDDPNIHRRVAYFFYWFSIYKPFYIIKGVDTPDIEIPDEFKFIIGYFNEIITYGLIQMILSSCVLKQCPNRDCKNNKEADLKAGNCSMVINLHQNKDVFEIFLSRLHNNKLNRSSLELLLSNSYIFMRCKNDKEPCPFHKIGFNKWRTFD